MVYEDEISLLDWMGEELMSLETDDEAVTDSQLVYMPDIAEIIRRRDQMREQTTTANVGAFVRPLVPPKKKKKGDITSRMSALLRAAPIV